MQTLLTTVELQRYLLRNKWRVLTARQHPASFSLFPTLLTNVLCQSLLQQLDNLTTLQDHPMNCLHESWSSSEQVRKWWFLFLCGIHFKFFLIGHATHEMTLVKTTKRNIDIRLKISVETFPFSNDVWLTHFHFRRNDKAAELQSNALQKGGGVMPCKRQCTTRSPFAHPCTLPSTDNCIDYCVLWHIERWWCWGERTPQNREHESLKWECIVDLKCSQLEDSFKTLEVAFRWVAWRISRSISSCCKKRGMSP